MACDHRLLAARFIHDQDSAERESKQRWRVVMPFEKSFVEKVPSWI
jgi:hypothetical protein